MNKPTPKELALAAQFLKHYAEKLGNAGCNDWEFPGDWTEEEIHQFKLDICEWNKGGESPEDWQNVPDWVAVAVLAKKIG